MPPQRPPGPDKCPDDMTTRLTVSNSRNQSNDTDSAITNRVRTLDSIKTFITILCDRQSNDMATVIRSSIELFNYCVSSREAVLVFYGELFSEYSTYYWIVKKRSISASSQQPGVVTSDSRAQQTRGKIEYVGELTRRFYQAAKLRLADEREDQESDTDVTQTRMLSPTKSIPTTAQTGPESPTGSSNICISPNDKTNVITAGPKIIPMSRRTSSCNSFSDTNDQTPMSPSACDGTEERVAELDEIPASDEDRDTVDIFSELESLITDIKTSLSNLIKKHMSKKPAGDATLQSPSILRDRLRSIISDWATELLVSLNSKHSQTSLQVATELNKTNPTNLVTRQINLCMANSVNNMLVDLLLDSHCDFKNLFGRMMSSAQNCDWLLAHLLLEMSRHPNCDREFASSMEFMIGCQSNINSLTYILAYLSDNNPKAMTNFPKSNIPFLISLCQSSISLLNVLALEIPDEISPNFLDNLAKEIYSRSHSRGHSACIESLTHCVIAAPNTYKLFLLAFDVVLHETVSQEVKSAAQIVIDSIVSQIHQRATQGLLPQTNSIPNVHRQSIDKLLNQINADLSKLIHKSITSNYIAKKAIAIFYRMSLIFGHTFASKVIGHYLNLPEDVFWPLLKAILKRFEQSFGSDSSTLVSQTLSIDANLRTATYYKNMNTLVVKKSSLKLDLDLISQLLSDKLCAATFDVGSTAQLIKMCCSSLERVDRARIKIATKHRLCKGLVTCYFLLLSDEKNSFPEMLSYIRITLTCMNLLKQSPVASHILCRSLLDRSVAYGHLFNKNFNPDTSSDCNEYLHEETSVRLSVENLKNSLGHRFRRLPHNQRNLPSTKPQYSKAVSDEDCMQVDDDDRPNKQEINSYLLVEAFKSSIDNIEEFANLFVEFHCPVMFDKHLWPTDEALRVINEKNLAILRKFEQVPPFWDLFEFIGQAKCLKICIVLVKALLAAHLALWAAATSKSCPDKMNSTLRLVPPLAQSGLIPSAFGLTADVFQHLSSNEVYSVLSDIWQYLKDTSSNSASTSETELTREEERAKAKLYLNRLRLFMCQHMPGSTYVEIFKEYYRPQPKTIPT